MSQSDLTRYTCQVALPGFGKKAQEALQQAKVLIIGAGGLGCPAAQYLAAAGVGALGIADFDVVSISNLHRQILYTAEDAGLKRLLLPARNFSSKTPEYV
jgi:molybdopterin/thiamine biosynthesis adenylyltransferase